MQTKKTELDSITDDGTRAIGWNKTGELLAVGDNERQLTIFDNIGQFLKQIDTQQKGFVGLDWHPDENLIMTVEEKISIYDFETENLKDIEDSDEDILMLCVAWHPNGEFFVTADYCDFVNKYSPLL